MTTRATAGPAAATAAPAAATDLMLQLSPRGARLAAPLALVLGAAALAGCSGGHSQTSPTAATPAASTSISASPGDAAAARLLARARTQLAAERSYRFDATEVVQAHTPVTTRLTGAVVRGQGVTYTLTVGKTRTQVIRLPNATYVRTVPGHWAQLRKPRPVADPARTLESVLTGLTNARTSSAAAGTVVTGTLPAAAARSAGIPVSGAGAQIAVTVDGQGHVVLLTVRTATSAGTQRVPVSVVTRYNDFDHVPALRRPTG